MKAGGDKLVKRRTHLKKLAAAAHPHTARLGEGKRYRPIEEMIAARAQQAEKAKQRRLEEKASASK